MKPLKYYQLQTINQELMINPGFLCDARHAAPIHNHDFFEFFMILNGNCIHNVNGQEQHLFEGDIVLIRPDDVHCYEGVGDMGCTFLNVNIHSEVMVATFEYLGTVETLDRFIHQTLPPVISIRQEEVTRLSDWNDRILMLCSFDSQKAKIQLKSMLIEVLSKYFDTAVEQSKQELPLWFESLLIQMQKKENFQKGLANAYLLSGRSIGHLNRSFQQHLGTTPTDYINKLRLNYSKSLLISTQLSVLELSMEAGFSNLSHFYHLFKEHFGVSPLTIRKIYSKTTR